MITNAMQVLLTAIKTVTALATTTGTSVGGVFPDITTITMSLPAAWVVYAGRVPTEKIQQGVVPRLVVGKHIFSVMVYLDNTQGQNNLLTVQLPILEAVVIAIRGLQNDSTLNNSFRFAFEGERLHSITPSRLTYEQRYSLIAAL